MRRDYIYLQSRCSLCIIILASRARARHIRVGEEQDTRGYERGQEGGEGRAKLGETKHKKEGREIREKKEHLTLCLALPAAHTQLILMLRQQILRPYTACVNKRIEMCWQLRSFVLSVSLLFSLVSSPLPLLFHSVSSTVLFSMLRHSYANPPLCHLSHVVRRVLIVLSSFSPVLAREKKSFP